MDEKLIKLVGAVGIVAQMLLLYWFWLTSLETFLLVLAYLITVYAIGLGFALAEREEQRSLEEQRPPAAEEERRRKQFCATPN
jgi:hypothetical protein